METRERTVPQYNAWRLTEDLSAEPNLNCPLKTMEKSDRIAAAQADRPAMYNNVR